MHDRSNDSAYLHALSTRSLNEHNNSATISAGQPTRKRDTAAARVWATLVPLLRCRSTARVWTAGNEYGATTRSKKWPALPTALYIYSRGLTRLLVLDLDAKTFGAAAVEQDARWLRTLIERAGGRVVEDFNPASGGRHLYVPLAEAATRRQLLPVLHALRAVCRTLDISPMRNAAKGCIVPPGSPTKDGATRQLVDELTAARDALTERSDRGLLPRLAAELATNTAESPDDDLPAPDLGDALEGLGDQARLQSALRLHSPLPGHVADFATHGAMTTWWQSRSEARQSVLTHLALRGWSLIDVHDAVHQRAIWPGLASSYAKYRTAADRQLARDWAKAQTTAATLGANFLATGHKKGLTAPTSSSGPFAVWLDRADRWCEREYANRPRRRAVVAAVLQALAAMAAVKEDLVNGTPTVAVGGRSLSIVAGLLPETTVWDVLAEIRDIPFGIGGCYGDFHQLEDQEVLALLRAASRKDTP